MAKLIQNSLRENLLQLISLKLISLSFIAQYSLSIFVSLLFFTELAVALPAMGTEEVAQQPSATQDATRNAAFITLGEANKLYKQGTPESLRQAIVKFEEALVLWRQLKDRELEAFTLNNIGAVYRDLGEKQKALESHNQALSLWRALGKRGGEARTLNNIGGIYDGLGEKQKALKYFNQALSLFRALGDRGGEATTLNNIGGIYSALGEKKKAFEYYNQALPLYRAVGDRSGEATTFNNIGGIYDALGEKQKALKYYEQVLSLRRAVGDRSGEVATLNNIGLVYSDLGEKQKALDYYKQALLLGDIVGDNSGKAAILNNIGLVYDGLGEKQKALKYYEQVLDLTRLFGNKFGEATTLNNIGGIYDDLGEKQKALEYFNQALSMKRSIGDKGGEAGTLTNIGFTYSALGEKQKALDYYNQALPLMRIVGDRRGEAATLNNIGLVYSALGETQKALESYNPALPLRRAVGDKGGEANTLSNIGSVYKDIKQPIEAIKNYEQSATITLQLRNNVGKENRKTFLESKQGGFTALVDLLIEQNQPERAFEWANLATVTDLADYTRLVNAKVGNPEAQKAIDGWNKKNIQLESLRKDLQEKFSEELSQRVNQLQEKVNQEAEEIGNRFLEAADLFETKPTDIAKLRASIPTDTTVIQPVLLTNTSNVPDTIALFIFSKDKLTVKKIPINPTKFKDLLTKTNASLTNRFDDKYLNNLEQLYNLLIRPIETEIQATKPKQLSFIASGKLRYIPFEALYDSKADKYLIEKLPISYLTRISPNSLAAKSAKTQSSKRVLAIGNPVPNGKLALRGAETEVKKITEIFPGSEAFINSQATLNTFKTNIPRFSLLLLATHGCFQKGGCPKLGLEENTLLFADKKFNIRDAALLGLQNTELITLSACQTALQTESNGEEISGLAYLFERAGAKATIASLWSAEDETTQEIMVEFYQNIKKGMSKDEALRQAKLSQIDSHPFFWSAFVLIGDAR
ncbi:MAG: tetratricopeptide repeat protein [Rivularia sp. (in: cyanobacteria)]